ncbi:Protein of unknown function [Bacillus mycoides]|nr:Protein of unknown function [Bacillus mycoides]
MIVAKGK